MSHKLNDLTRAVKRYDYDLYADFDARGTVCIWKKIKTAELILDCDGLRLYNVKPTRQYVCALTDNWSQGGKKRDWGIDRVLSRVRELDSFHNERLLEKIDAQNEKVDQAGRRSMRNEAEAFWSDNVSAFKKATNDILIHSLSKDEPKKRLRDRRIKDGNY